MRMEQHLRNPRRTSWPAKTIWSAIILLADVTFIPFYTRRERYKVAIDEYPNVKRWAENLIARPQVAPTF